MFGGGFLLNEAWLRPATNFKWLKLTLKIVEVFRLSLTTLNVTSAAEPSASVRVRDYRGGTLFHREFSQFPSRMRSRRGRRMTASSLRASLGPVGQLKEDHGDHPCAMSFLR